MWPNLQWVPKHCKSLSRRWLQGVDYGGMVGLCGWLPSRSYLHLYICALFLKPRSTQETSYLHFHWIKVVSTFSQTFFKNIKIEQKLTTISQYLCFLVMFQKHCNKFKLWCVASRKQSTCFPLTKQFLWAPEHRGLTIIWHALCFWWCLPPKALWQVQMLMCSFWKKGPHFPLTRQSIWA